MNNQFKAIAIGLIPTFEKDDYSRVRKMLWGNEVNKENEEKLKEELSKIAGGGEVFLFESGRSSLYHLLNAFDIKNGDEVIIQAFTCSVVPGAIRALGSKVVYVDIDNSYNMEFDDLRKKITSKTKIIIVQHTFGKAARIKEIKKLCDDNKIILIEDLAHGLGGETEGKKLGSFGQAAIMSFGRDKVISGIWGGAVVLNNSEIRNRLSAEENSLVNRDESWVRKQLMYPLMLNLCIQSYKFLSVGKILHLILKKSRMLGDAISAGEKEGGIENVNYKMDERLMEIIFGQIKKIDKFIKHRRILAKYYADELGETYDSESTYMRYTIEVDNPNGLRNFAAKRRVFLGDWYDQAVAPKSIKPANFGYETGGCPNAEEAVKRVVNLPTNPNINLDDARIVVSIIKEWKSKK